MIARKSFLIVSTHFISQFLGWIGLVILARSWGSDIAPAALGSIGFALSFLALFNIIADLGFSRAHVKRISEGKDLGTCIGTYATIKLLLTGLMITVVFAAIFIWKAVFNQNFSDATTENVILVLMFYYVFLNLTQIATFTFEGRQEIAKRQIVNAFISIKTPFLIFVALAGVTGLVVRGKLVHAPTKIAWPEYLQPLQKFVADHAIGSLAITYAFAMIATFLVGFWFLRKYPIKRPSMELFKSYFSFALPTILFSLIAIISLNIDKIMIGIYWDDVEVGYYFSMQQILTMITIFYIAVGTVLFPTISKYHSSNRIDKIKEITHKAERYISMVMIPPLIFIIVLVTPVISTILSTDFLPAKPVLITLAAYTFFFSLNRPYGALLNGMNKPGLSTKIGLIMCLVNIPLNFLLIPENGLLSSLGINGPTGAAIATLISVMVGFVGLRLTAKKLSGIKLLQSHTPRHLIAGAAMGATIYFIAYRTTLFPEKFWYVLIFLGCIGLLVYLGVLFLLREFKKQDFLFFLDIIHPHKMVKYVSSELKEKPKK